MRNRSKRNPNLGVARYRKGQIPEGAKLVSLRQLRLKSMHNRNRLEVLAVFGLTLIILAATLYSSSTPKITYTDIAFLNKADSNGVALQAKQTLQDQGFKSLLKPSLDLQAAANALEQTPDIKSANVRLNIFQARPKFEISLESPKAWLTVEGQKYLVGESGIIMGKGLTSLKDYFPPAQTQPIEIIDNSKYSEDFLALNQLVISAKDLDFISSVSQALKSAGEQGSGTFSGQLTFEVNSNPRELRLSIEGVPYKIIFFLDNEAGEQTATLYETIEYFKSSPATQPPQEYIDVRLAPKVVYK